MISVIIPTYNCASYIVDAVESVLRQTYKNIEIIIVDDGSSDQTQTVLKPYRGLIRYVCQPNEGSSKARNVGLSMAKGEYIAFLDADDVWEPYKLEMEYRTLEALTSADMVFTNYSIIDENGNMRARSFLENGFPIFSEYNVRVKDFFDETVEASALGLSTYFPLRDKKIYYGNVFDKLFMGNFILPSTEMLRNKKNGNSVLFNERYTCAVDQDFHLRFSKNNKIAYIDCSSARYRVNRKNQLSGKTNTPQLILNTIESRLNVIENDHEFFSKNEKHSRGVVARNYSRLAYYYLSELNTVEAKKYSLQSIEYNPLHVRAWMILLASFIPAKFLAFGRISKSFTRKGSIT